MSSARPACGMSTEEPHQGGAVGGTVHGAGDRPALQQAAPSDPTGGPQLVSELPFWSGEWESGEERRLFRFPRDGLFPGCGVCHVGTYFVKMHVLEDVTEPRCDITGRHGQQGRGRAMWTRGSLSIITDPGHLASGGLPCPTAAAFLACMARALPQTLGCVRCSALPGVALCLHVCFQQRHMAVACGCRVPETGFICGDTCQGFSLRCSLGMGRSSLFTFCCCNLQ